MIKTLLLIFPLLITLCHAEEVKILSWNVFMLPKPVRFSLQNTRTDLIVEELLKSDADIILLQEAFSGKFKSELKKKSIDKYPYQYYLNRRIPSLKIFGSGLYYMSKHPFEVLERVYFKRCTIADCFAAKGSAVVEVSLPSGRKIQVANTHLQAGGKNIKIRFKQLAQIKKALASVAAPGVPQILAGDMNIDALSGNSFERLLSEMDMTSAPLEGEPDYSNGFPTECYSKPGKDGKEWIDHLLLSSQSYGAYVAHKKVIPFSGILKGRECPLSDHWGVETIVQL